MARSYKKNPFGYHVCCRGEKQDRIIANRLHRRINKIKLHIEGEDFLPALLRENHGKYDWSSDDSKYYAGGDEKKDWYKKMMRK